MADDDCVRFLQWALPHLGMRWAGFRKPRRQVCRRVAGRARELGLDGFDAYRQRLEADPDEWRVLDGLCRVTISRFRRDHSVWDGLVREVLPELARDRDHLRAWSCGCASGEEATTLVLAFSDVEVIGTDIDEAVLERARRGCYEARQLDELPRDWRSGAFDEQGCLREPFRGRLRFERQDVREAAPAGPFDLVFCRNLAFTYFDEPTQRAVLARLVGALRPGGALVIARNERLPAGHGLDVWLEGEGVYRVTPA